MTDDRDPVLLSLFDAAMQEKPDDTIVTTVMAQIDKQRRRTVIGWIVVGAAVLPLVWWLSGPLTSIVSLAAQIFPESLVNVEDQWLAQLLSPINSIAGVVGLAFLGAWMAYRKIFT